MDDNQVSFEEAYAQLRETVKALEAGNLPLAEATRLFEEGMRLAKQCNSVLSAAELKITKLQQEYTSLPEESADHEEVASLDDMPAGTDSPALPFDEP